MIWERDYSFSVIALRRDWHNSVFWPGQSVLSVGEQAANVSWMVWL